MEMVLFRTSSVFFMCWLLFLLITLQKSHSQPPPLPNDFSVCKEQSYKCGNLRDILYPFWGYNRPPQCGGGDQFKLNCHVDNNTTTILIGSQVFTVKDIKMKEKIMRLVLTDLVHYVCYPYFDNTYVNYFNPTVFGYLSPYNITIFYDCPLIKDFPSGHRFTCGHALSYFGVKNEEPFKTFWTRLRSCNRSLDVPSDAEFKYDNAASGDRALTNLLNEGFEVNYNVSEDCARCLGSQGECDGIEKHIDSCYYCSDGSYDCYHPKKTTFALSMKITIGVGSAVMTGFMICLIICCRKCTSLPRHVKFWLRTRNDHDIEAFLSKHGALAQRRYKFSEVKKMTNFFKVKLGEGGFGAVYKGELFNGSPVAVKILNASKGNGEDFINEVASISSTSHVNVVSLLGYCLEGNKKALIYEFMPNGSLDKFIYNKGLEITTSLSWDNLWQIAIGIARGLEYLHKGCNTRILHFDIKSHNILLDENFCPKISDFGLAKLCPRKESIISMSDARGTIGYVAPEVWNRHFGGISHKSDVYSYGMMLLEMVGGRKNINAEANNTSEIYFPHWVYNRLEQGEDLRPNGVIATEENEIARRMTVVGLWCVQTLPKDRPTITRVIDMLEGNMNSLQVPPKPVLSSPPRLVPLSTTSSSQFG